MAMTAGSGEARRESWGEFRAVDGRIPGLRGRATRARLLQATVRLLGATSYRELKVIDIGREAKTSPATFYQYFPDVEAAILALAAEMAAEASELAPVVRHANWAGRAAQDAAQELVDAVLGFCDRHRPVLRVVDLASGDGDTRFLAIRSKIFSGVAEALTDALVQHNPGARELDPCATASVLVAMLVRVASQQYGFEFGGIRREDTRRSLAAVLHWGVTGR